jgi:hypothetical protein
MIHSIDDIPTPIRTWEPAYDAYLKVCNAFSDRGYATIHALKVRYEWRARCQGRWLVVQEIQNDHTLTCFYLCYVAGARGSVSERTPGGHRRLSPHRLDLSLHSIPPEGLEFWAALEAAGYDSDLIRLAFSEVL